MFDDLGYGDLTAYGPPPVETPNIDSIGAEGMTFRQAYAGAPVCTPSRAALLTGRYAQRVGLPRVIHPDAQRGMPAWERTLPEVLGDAGYATGIFGKWHLGDPAVRAGHHPEEHGFERFFGLPYSNDMKPLPLYKGRERAERIDTGTPEEVDRKQGSLHGRYTDAALKFIRTSKEQDRPFFCYLPHSAPHQPFHLPEGMSADSKPERYRKLIQAVDAEVGRVLDELRSQELEENTLVIVTSDNGPWYVGETGGLNGRKTDPFEGGVRIPFIARWPGVIPHKDSQEPISFIDMLPTLSNLAGAEPPQDRKIDGIDIRPALEGRSLPGNRALFFYGDTVKGPNGEPEGEPPEVDPAWNVGAVREGRWKLVRRNPPHREHAQLYNLEADPNERNNVIDRPGNQDTVARLRRLANDFDEEIKEQRRAALRRSQ